MARKVAADVKSPESHETLDVEEINVGGCYYHLFFCLSIPTTSMQEELKDYRYRMRDVVPSAISIRLQEESGGSYEELRSSNITRNQAFLHALGLTSHGRSQADIAPTKQRNKRQKTVGGGGGGDDRSSWGGGGGGGGTGGDGGDGEGAVKGGPRKSLRDTRVDPPNAPLASLKCLKCTYITHPKGPIAAQKELAQHLQSSACNLVEELGEQCIEIAPRARLPWQLLFQYLNN